MPIPNANESYFPLNQNDIRLAWGIKMLLEAIPNSILAVSISPKLPICPPMAKSSWKMTRHNDNTTMPCLIPNLSRK